MRTKAIVPVHFTGQMCDMRWILDVARRRGLFVVEDAAQAFGSSQDGGMCGSLGELSCFSMNPMKVLAAYGEAGIVLTDDPLVEVILEPDELFDLAFHQSGHRHTGPPTHDKGNVLFVDLFFEHARVVLDLGQNLGGLVDLAL